MTLRRALVCLILLLAITPASRADSIRLPLNGYYHPGRWFPVQWSLASTPPGGTIRISATGGITTIISDPSTSGIAPWLPLTRLTSPLQYQTPAATGQIAPSDLHAVPSSEKLVGVAVNNPVLAAHLYPGEVVIQIPLDPAAPLPGAAMAWETLDAVVLTPAALQQISPESRRLLYAAGVTLAVTGDAPPDQSLAWSHAGALWVAASGIAPPPPVDEAAYEPMLGWDPGRSHDFRLRIILFGVLACIVVAGLALWRSRWMPLAQLIAAGLAVGGLWMWNTAQSPVAVESANVYLTGIHPAIVDRWTFQISHHDAEFHLPAEGIPRLIFYQYDQPMWTDMRLICVGDGKPMNLSGHLRTDWPLVAVSRQTAPGEVPRAVNPVTTPLRALEAESIYPGFKTAGQNASTAHWPDLVLQKIPPS